MIFIVYMTLLNACLISPRSKLEISEKRPIHHRKRKIAKNNEPSASILRLMHEAYCLRGKHHVWHTSVIDAITPHGFMDSSVYLPDFDLYAYCRS